jgi:hypothetical protein
VFYLPLTRKSFKCPLASKLGRKRKTHEGYFGEIRRGKRQLGGPTGRWVNNIKIVLGGIGWGSVDWIGLAQDRDK